MTRYHEEDEVMEFFSSIPSDEAGNLATSILLFSDVLAMKGVDEVFAYFLGKDDVVWMMKVKDQEQKNIKAKVALLN